MYAIKWFKIKKGLLKSSYLSSCFYWWPYFQYFCILVLVHEMYSCLYARRLFWLLNIASLIEHWIEYLFVFDNLLIILLIFLAKTWLEFAQILLLLRNRMNIYIFLIYLIFDGKRAFFSNLINFNFLNILILNILKILFFFHLNLIMGLLRFKFFIISLLFHSVYLL